MSIFLTGTILYRYERTFHDLSMFTPRSCVLHCIFEASRVPLLKKKRERKEYSRSTQRQDWTVLAVTVHPSPPQATRSTQRQDGDCSAVTVNHRPHPGLAHPCRHKINATSGPGPGGGFDGRPGPGGRGRGGRGFPSIFHMLHLHLAESKKVARKLLYMLLLSSDAVKKKKSGGKRDAGSYTDLSRSRDWPPCPRRPAQGHARAAAGCRRSESVTVRPPAACVYSTRCCFKAQQSARPRDGVITACVRVVDRRRRRRQLAGRVRVHRQAACCMRGD